MKKMLSIKGFWTFEIKFKTQENNKQKTQRNGKFPIKTSIISQKYLQKTGKKGLC